MAISRRIDEELHILIILLNTCLLCAEIIITVAGDDVFLISFIIFNLPISETVWMMMRSAVITLKREHDRNHRQKNMKNNHNPRHH